MKKKFNETQIVAILKEGETEIPVAELCRKYGIGQSTYFTWKSKYTGMTVVELKRLKQLEVEILRLKRMCTSLNSDHELLKEVLEKKGVDVSAELSQLKS